MYDKQDTATIVRRQNYAKEALYVFTSNNEIKLNNPVLLLLLLLTILRHLSCRHIYNDNNNTNHGNKYIGFAYSVQCTLYVHTRKKYKRC